MGKAKEKKLKRWWRWWRRPSNKSTQRSFKNFPCYTRAVKTKTKLSLSTIPAATATITTTTHSPTSTQLQVALHYLMKDWVIHCYALDWVFSTNLWRIVCDNYFSEWQEKYCIVLWQHFLFCISYVYFSPIYLSDFVGGKEIVGDCICFTFPIFMHLILWGKRQ